MPEFVDNTVKEIDERLRKLHDERSRLEAARLALTGGRRGPGRPVGSTAGATRTRSRRRTARRRTAATINGRRSNTRATQALELVSKRPGITIPELAKAMRIQPNYLYRVLPRLAADGHVKRDGQGWRPAA